MAFELTEQQRRELTRICLHRRVRRLELFGSAAGERFNAERSDLDFLVEFVPLDGGHADAYFGLLEDLEKLFSRRVDLVMASGIKNPYFRENIRDSRVVLYAA